MSFVRNDCPSGTSSLFNEVTVLPQIHGGLWAAMSTLATRLLYCLCGSYWNSSQCFLRESTQIILCSSKRGYLLKVNNYGLTQGLLCIIEAVRCPGLLWWQRNQPLLFPQHRASPSVFPSSFSYLVVPSLEPHKSIQAILFSIFSFLLMSTTSRHKCKFSRRGKTAITLKLSKEINKTTSTIRLQVYCICVVEKKNHSRNVPLAI